jgi:hypothetical protein
MRAFQQAPRTDKGEKTAADESRRMRTLIFLALLSVAAMTACHGSAQNASCTAHFFRYTDDENKALLELHSGKYRAAYDGFAKAGRGRLDCASSQNGRAQSMNAGYAAFDAAAQADAARHLGMDEDARRLMASARQMAADVLKSEGLPPTMRWSMQRLANQ